MTQGHLSLIIALFLGTSRIAAGWEIANRDEMVEMVALIKPVIGPVFYSPRSSILSTSGTSNGANISSTPNHSLFG